MQNTTHNIQHTRTRSLTEDYLKVQPAGASPPWSKTGIKAPPSPVLSYSREDTDQT